MSHETYIICTERKCKTTRVIVLLTMIHDNDTSESAGLGWKLRIKCISASGICSCICFLANFKEAVAN